VAPLLLALDGLSTELGLRASGARTPIDPPMDADALVYLYEVFLAAYSPQTRSRDGVVYTPQPVVDAVIGQVDRTLRHTLGMTAGVADTTDWQTVSRRAGLPTSPLADPSDPFLRVVDPAMGTGAFLLGLLRKTIRNIPSSVDLLETTTRFVGIERSIPALVLAHIRLSTALHHAGVPLDRLAQHTLHLVHADTLRDPSLLDTIPFTVVIGNPPFHRESTASAAGGWIRRGHPTVAGGRPPLADYTTGARGRDLKSLYNLYAYFWRWSAWRVFEHAGGLGVIGLVTASSFLRGPGFAGMRAHLRSQASGLDVVDLEGDGRGPNPSENVFEIATPVCISTVWYSGIEETIPTLRYARLSGSRGEKLERCAALATTDDAVDWTHARTGGDTPLVATAARPADSWPLLTDLFPWQHSGVQYKRTWTIAPSAAVLEQRWQALLTHPDRAEALRSTAARTIDATPRRPVPLPALSTLAPGSPPPPIRRYAARSFDRRHALFDPRVCDRLRPALWQVHGPGQIYLTSLLTGAVGPGPTVTLSAHVPDLHHFRGSYGGKDVVPLWRDAACTHPNLTRGVAASLAQHHGQPPSAPDLFAYAVAVLAQPAFQRRSGTRAHRRGPHLPITADADLFQEGVALGRALVFLQTFGARLAPSLDARLPRGSASEVQPISREPEDLPQRWRYDPAHATLHVGTGAVGPVSPAVMSWSVSGLSVVPSWLDHRIGAGRGRRSSPLDAIRADRWTDTLSQELLELLWVIEGTLAMLPALEDWLDRILARPLVPATALPAPSPACRAAPRPS